MGAQGNTPVTPQNAIELAGPEDGRLFFSGPPKALRGTIPLINSGTVKQKIQAIGVNACELMGASGQPLREFPFYAKLYPGEQANISGKIMLDPRTRPAEYDIEVTVGSKTLPATVHVAEVVDLRMYPTEITILAGSAKTYTRKFTIENAGNVELPLGARCEAPIFDSFDLVSSLLIGLHDADKDSVESMVKGFLSEWGELQAGTLVVTREPIILYPGKKITAEAVFELPAELKGLRHYQANLQLYNAVLSVDIYTTAKTGSTRNQKSET